MQRGRMNTVTEEAKLSVLIPCPPSEAEGFATFAPEDGKPQAVRAFRNADLKNAKKHLPGNTGRRFTAVMKLKRALENPDDPISEEESLRALAEADHLLRSGPESPLRAAIPPDVPENLVEDVTAGKLAGHALIEKLEHFWGLRPGPRASKDPGWLLSYVISMELREARLVLWWKGKTFRPALWCPDMKTAFYARVLLDVVGGKGFRMCPHCGAWFVQDRADQTYCSVAHREAHRVARWRAQQKLKATEKGKRRKKDGTHKAR
jgi:hypothetical protein